MGHGHVKSGGCGGLRRVRVAGCVCVGAAELAGNALVEKNDGTCEMEPDIRAQSLNELAAWRTRGLRVHDEPRLGVFGDERSILNRNLKSRMSRAWP